MRTIYIILFLLLLMNTSNAQQSPSNTISKSNYTVQELYQSPQRQEAIKSQYERLETTFSDVTAKDAISRIESMIDRGYKSVNNSKTLQKYIDELNIHKNDSKKVKEIYFYAITNAIPPENMILDTPEKVDAYIKESQKSLEDSMGLNKAELEQIMKTQHQLNKSSFF